MLVFIIDFYNGHLKLKLINRMERIVSDFIRTYIFKIAKVKPKLELTTNSMKPIDTHINHIVRVTSH